MATISGIKGNDSIGQVDVVGPMTREQFLRTFEDLNRPVIVDEGVRSWPAYATWTTEYIREKCGSNSVTVRTYQNGVERWHGYRGALLEEVLAYAEGGNNLEPIYLARGDVNETIPQIADDLRVPEFVPPGSVELSTIWIGRSSFTRLHYHVGVEAAACLLRGQKRFWLWPPSASKRLKPVSSMRSSFNYSRLEGVGPQDLDRIPGGISVLLSAGQILYIPVGWWHAVQGSNDLSILNTIFYTSRIRNWSFPYPGIPSLFWSFARRPISGIVRSILHG
jgi:Cupin-like domain